MSIARAVFNELEWINTLQYGIVLAGGDGGDGGSPGDDTVDGGGAGDDTTDGGQAGDDTVDGGGAGDDTVAGGAGDQQQQPLQARVRDWRDKEIAKLRAKNRALETAAKAPSAAGTPPAVIPPTGDQAELDRLIEQRAEAKRAQDEFNRQCNEVVTNGREAFPDFMSRVDELKQLRDLTNPSEAAQYNSFVGAVLETEAPARLLYELGANPDEADRITALGPVKQGIELEKLARRLAEPPKASDAPKPPRVPPGSGGSAGGSHVAIAPTDPERSDRLSTAEWMRRRNAQTDRWDAARR
jgi:Ca2+-binding RTX toxin-like protein